MLLQIDGRDVAYGICLAVDRFAPQVAYSLGSPFGPHFVRYYASLRSYSGYIAV